MKRLLVIDGNHLARRSFHAMGYMSTRSGIQSGVVYISLRIIRKLMLKFNPERIIAVFDGGLEQQRKKVSTYKQFHKKAPKHFYSQLGDLQKALSYIGITTVRVQGVEADTLIGITSWKFYERVDGVYVISSDSDMLQLLNKKIRVYDDRKGKLWDTEEFSRNFPSSKPYEIIYVKSIAGDSPDDVEGVPGVGKATAWSAVKILREHVFNGGRNGLALLQHKEYRKKYLKACKGSGRLARIADYVDRIVANERVVKIPHFEGVLEEESLTDYRSQIGTSLRWQPKKLEELLIKYECLSLQDSLVESMYPLYLRGRTV